jgi:hypothetical protein
MILKLPCTYSSLNLVQITKDLTKLNANYTSTLIALDIKDVCVNIPTNEILHITKSVLRQNNNDTLVSEQIFMLLNMVLNQNILSMLINFINQTKE